MRHSYFGKKLSRTKNERRRLFQNLVRSLILHDEIETTLAKAKAVQPLMETLITKAKVGTSAKKRALSAVIADDQIVARLWEKATSQFKARSSGFTRIVKLATRRGDNTQAVRLSFVDAPAATVVPEKAPKAAPIKVAPAEQKKKSVAAKSTKTKTKTV